VISYSPQINYAPTTITNGMRGPREVNLEDGETRRCDPKLSTQSRRADEKLVRIPRRELKKQSISSTLDQKMECVHAVAAADQS
jgi:hypothetical protein